jgi:hypothetical protein
MLQGLKPGSSYCLFARAEAPGLLRRDRGTSCSVFSAMKMFCTIVHMFAQSFAGNLIDGKKDERYRAPQIEPGSLKTLRVNVRHAAA